MNSADGFAIAMIVILGASFGMVFVLLLSIVRHGGRRDHDVEQLLDEVERESRPPREPRQPAGESPAREEREPWEKEPDWWKR